MIMLLAASIVAIIACGAVAVDLSARMDAAQDLQNAADSAALGGVVVWVDTADETVTRLKVDEMIDQNGSNRTDISVVVAIIDATTIQVEVTQDSTQGFLAVGTLGELTRTATASFDKCSAPCGSTIPIPEPFLSIDALGSGDGFRPAIVGTKLYGVNHHSDTMACVDRITQAACFEDGNLFASSDYETDWTVSEAVVGSKIYYLGQGSTDIRLFCWETTTDTLCPSQQLAELESDKFRGGATVAVGGQVYSVTDNHRMHCYRPNGSTCPFFGSDGLATGLGALIAPLAAGDTVGNMDVTHDVATGRIYYSMKVEGADEGSYVDCWNTLTETPCFDFPAVLVDTNPQKKGARLFLHNPPRAAVTDTAIADGVCATNDGQINCYDFLTGSYRGVWGDSMEVGLLGPVDNGGTHINHPPTNRLVLQADGVNLCWDFDAQANCGFTDASANKDYGFAYEGNCVFALGHNSVFHAFGMTDPQLSNACPGTSSVARIDPCSCASGPTWPRVSFEFELTAFTNFTVLFRDPAGNIVMGPIDMTGHPTGRLDLSSIATFDYLIIETVAEVDQALVTSPWDEDTPPEIHVGLARLPRLVD